MSKNIEICKAEEVGSQILDEQAKDISSVQERAKKYGIPLDAPSSNTGIEELRALLSVFATKVMDVFDSFIADLQSTIASLNASIAAYIAQIADMNSDIADAYDAVEDKGGTLPDQQTSANLPAAIESIPAVELAILGTVEGRYLFDNIADPHCESVDTRNMTNFQYLFWNKRLVKIVKSSNWNTGNVTNMNYLFSSAHLLEWTDITSWDFSKVTNIYNAFNDMCANPTLIGNHTLQDVENGVVILRGLKISVSLLTGTKNFATILAAANGVADLTGQSAQTITFAASVYNTLTSEQQARISTILYNKGWNLATS